MPMDTKRYQFADLSDEQEQQLRQVEQNLGVILIAYEPKENEQQA